MSYTLWFDKAGKEAIGLVGGKNASLGELIRAEIPVPPGFSVTTEAYLEFLTGWGMKETIESILSRVDLQDVASLEDASNGIRQLMAEASFTKKIEEEIRSDYQALAQVFDVADLPVAVRSSATAEDLPGASFAGQQDTFLWVKGCNEVLEKIKLCMSSLFTPRAISYRMKMGFPHEKVLISVGVQKLVDAEAAGVMFTLNPLNGDPSKVIIEGNWGLGETVVSGQVNPDKFVVDKVTKEIERTVSQKGIECIFDPEKGIVRHLDIPPERREVQCIEDEEVLELARYAKKVEEYYGCPQDIEWAIDKNRPFPFNIFMVQSRPETVWSQQKKEPVLGKKSGYELLMEKALTRVKVSY
ncbi:MAG TPA: PEP/pyruvate-binding domain-containing protein [Thermodesulfobacteriota bacterium]|nr:PEP/pyruvate-binding domain-containing protein [Thermodesulfobacteriota bacterium]